MKSLASEKALVILSGGQDSTTCLYWALEQFHEVETLTYDYGQRHRREIAAAALVAERAGVPNTVLHLSAFTELGGSSLTESLPIQEHGTKDGLPNTFVPGRNLIFLTYAAAYAYQRSIQHLVLGVCETDYSGYPDCRAETLKSTLAGINLGMEANFLLHTPLMLLSKKETVLLAKELGALSALAATHTCYNGTSHPCGTCPACLLRAKGFAEADIPDPLVDSE
ncbi:7-cyano-7-deazaguanine synthase QueC [bacterium]|nr:7-cyano-7-deazaguanine synthase QueC [bacterium]